MKTALSIAGSDCSGGAGIQADLKTMTMQGVYAMSAITALTAQNTTGVTGVLEVPADFLEKQLDAIFTDIFPDAVKIGMVANGDLIRMIAKKLRQYQARNIVVDPVMVATSGSDLVEEEAIDVLQEELFPLATLITPNIPEAERLTGRKITTAREMQEAAARMWEKFHCNVLLKGGHSVHDANDLLYTEEGAKWIQGRRIENDNTHGTGCTLSSAIAAHLAKGSSLEQAVRHGKEYICGALEDGMNLGKGSGPLNHGFAIEKEKEDIV